MGQFLNFKGDYVGLDESEVDKSLSMYGANSDSKLDEDGKGFSVSHVFLNIRFFMMAVAAVLEVISGAIPAGILLALLCIGYVWLEIYKGVRCDEELSELRAQSAMKYRVIRDDELQLVRKEMLVPDDIIILQGGENVPADIFLLEISELTVDESLFTKDKTAVTKQIGADTKNELKRTCVYKGTKLLTGSLIGRVTATGVDTKRFKTFGAPTVDEVYYTAFETAINKAIPIFSIFAGIILVICAVFSFIGGTGDSDNVISTITGALLPAISFALCFIPAEVGSLVRIYYIRCAKRLSSKRSTVKDLFAIESLNAMTSFIIDKTGTVTKSHMEVADEYTKNADMLANISVLACDPSPSDAIDKALVLSAALRQCDVKELQGLPLLRHYPFTESGRIVGNLREVGDARLLCVKGAPESVLTLCDMSGEALLRVQRKQLSFAKNGYQVIAAAFAQLEPDAEVPEQLYDVKYTFMGLIALTNQTRDTIPVAVRNCYRAGVDVIMTTGDDSETAAAVARKIGLRQGGLVTGEQLRRASETGEKVSLKGVNIFARITPEQKIEIIKLLQDSGEIVGITGDSTTDSEILEQADVGITMAQHASGAAYEACDLVMNDDNFNGIVEVVKEARQMHRNVKRCISLALSAVIALVLFCAVNLLTSGSLLITPLLAVVLTALVIPALAMVFVDNGADIRSDLTSSGFIGRGRINKRFFVKAALQGVALGIAAIFVYLLTAGDPSLADEGRAVIMTVISSGLITMGAVNLSEKRVAIGCVSHAGIILPLICGSVMLLDLVIIYVPLINSMFGIAAINPFIFILALAMGAISQLWIELGKLHSGNK